MFLAVKGTIYIFSEYVKFFRTILDGTSMTGVT